jgi:hypothetical protein
MVDIEYYLKQSEKDYSKWRSELDRLPMVKGLTLFLKDNLGKESFDYKQFVSDAEKIQELRGLLYEHFDNTWRPIDEASKSYYNEIFYGTIKEKIESFARKDSLKVDKD